MAACVVVNLVKGLCLNLWYFGWVCWYFGYTFCTWSCVERVWRRGGCCDETSFIFYFASINIKGWYVFSLDRLLFLFDFCFCFLFYPYIYHFVVLFRRCVVHIFCMYTILNTCKSDRLFFICCMLWCILWSGFCLDCVLTKLLYICILDSCTAENKCCSVTHDCIIIVPFQLELHFFVFSIYFSFVPCQCHVTSVVFMLLQYN